MKEAAHFAKQMLVNIPRSPYSNRIFPVIDSVHASGLVDKLSDIGIPRENIVVWDKNGIEHNYPRAILEAIFGTFPSLQITGDAVSANGILLRKTDLANKVTERLTPDTRYPDEFQTKLLAKLDSVVF